MGGFARGRAIERTVLGTDPTTWWSGLLHDAGTAVLERSTHLGSKLITGDKT
jgi:hypothetical protein